MSDVKEGKKKSWSDESALKRKTLFELQSRFSPHLHILNMKGVKGEDAFVQIDSEEKTTLWIGERERQGQEGIGRGVEVEGV